MEQGPTEFSDLVPSAHSCLTLADWELAAGRAHVWNRSGAVLDSPCFRCQGSRRWIRPLWLLTHQHLLKDSSCLTSGEDKDLEKDLGVIYYVKIWIAIGFSCTSDEVR